MAVLAPADEEGAAAEAADAAPAVAPLHARRRTIPVRGVARRATGPATAPARRRRSQPNRSMWPKKRRPL
jgi:hypothetical protein